MNAMKKKRQKTASSVRVKGGGAAATHGGVAAGAWGDAAGRDIKVTHITQHTTVDVADIVETLQRAHQNKFRSVESQYQSALTALTDAVRALADRCGDQATPGVDEALAALKSGDTGKAEVIFQGIVARSAQEIEETAKTYRHLGALAYLHDTNKALNAYRMATDLDPTNGDGWNQLGHLLYRTGDLSGAEAAYRRVESLGVKNNERDLLAVAYGNLGIVYKTRGDLARAEAMYHKSLELNEALGRQAGMAAQYGNLGIVYHARVDLAQAEAMYRKSLELFQDVGADP